MSEPFNAANHGQEHHFDAFLDALVTGRTSRHDESTPASASASASDLGAFARDLHQTAIPPLSPARKQAMWTDLMLAHPSPNHPRHAGSTGPALPPALTIPASRPPERSSRLRHRYRLGDPRLGFLPPFVMRPATIVMLTIAMMLAAVAGLAGLGQSKDPGSMTPTALASEHLIVATPMPCLIASPVASPSSTSAGVLTSTTSTPAIATSLTATPTTPTGTPACAAATPAPSD